MAGNFCKLKKKKKIENYCHHLVQIIIQVRAKRKATNVKLIFYRTGYISSDFGGPNITPPPHPSMTTNFAISLYGHSYRTNIYTYGHQIKYFIRAYTNVIIMTGTHFVTIFKLNSNYYRYYR